MRLGGSININEPVLTTFYYGHIDDPRPLKVRGKVIHRILERPWKVPLVGIPISVEWLTLKTFSTIIPVEVNYD